MDQWDNISGEQIKAWNKHKKCAWRTFPWCFTWRTKKSRSRKDKQSNKWCYSEVQQASQRFDLVESPTEPLHRGICLGGYMNDESSHIQDQNFNSVNWRSQPTRLDATHSAEGHVNRFYVDVALALEKT